MSSSLVSLNTHHVGERCTLNLSRAQTSSRWWYGSRRGRSQLRCRPRLLTMIQNYELYIIDICDFGDVTLEIIGERSGDVLCSPIKSVSVLVSVMQWHNGESIRASLQSEVWAGHSGPVVNVSDRGRHVTSSSLVPLKIRRVGERCIENLSRAQTSSRGCGVVVRRGGCQLRCHPRHLTMVENGEVHRKKRPQRTEQHDVNIHSLTHLGLSKGGHFEMSWMSIVGSRPT
ncbi:uncharacterized protein TNCV_4170941 [Trichonephila clavipes]|nr:uncharacterized protein TNCV_4170941 [Trichonephila clavipes]